jgi:DNA polymerase-3 subunit delta'
MPVTVYPWLEDTWRTLLARRKSLPHALLFAGREGIGKIDLVRRLAQSMACEAPAADGAACAACQSCRWYAAESHPDYREIRPESMRAAAQDAVEPASDADASTSKRKPSQEIRIEDVRGLQDFIFLSSHQRGGRIIVFYPAETLNANAANALLKCLEEPPAGTYFMLVAHRPGDLPATIHSRCQKVILPTPDVAQAEQWLRTQGMAEPALSLAQTGNAPLLALTMNEPEYWHQRKSLFDGLTAATPDALALAERLREVPVARLLGWLQRWTYDLLSVRAGGPVRYNPDYRQSLVRLAATTGAIEISRYHRDLLREQRTVSHPLNARLYAERLLLTYAALMRRGAPRNAMTSC